jgi:transposase InsO family protein
MSRENPLWGAPRIHSELLKLGMDVGETSVSKYLIRRRRPPSQTWRTFLENHVTSMVSVDFFTVPTIPFQILYVFLVLAHDRRRILHFGVTTHPTAEWTAHQLREALPWDSAPRYLLRDRDRIFGQEFVEQVKAMGIKQVLSAPRSPWQRAYIERVIGTIRRECLDHVIVLHQASLSRHLNQFFEYYHRSRCHLSLEKDPPEPRPVQPPEQGCIASVPQVGGLHHRYERRAARARGDLSLRAPRSEFRGESPPIPRRFDFPALLTTISCWDHSAQTATGSGAGFCTFSTRPRCCRIGRKTQFTRTTICRGRHGTGSTRGQAAQPASQSSGPTQGDLGGRISVVLPPG